MPEIPEGAKTPADHKAKKPKKKPKTHEFRGETYTLVDPEIMDDVDVLEAFDNQQITTALRLIFGEREYQRLKRNLADPETGRTKASDIGEFFYSMQEHQDEAKN